MSVQTEINRITENVAESYDAAEALGASLPAQQNSDNLPETIRAIPTAKIVQGKGDSTTDVMSQAAASAELNNLSEEIGDLKMGASLGIASDGLIYLFIDGEPVGSGIPQSTGQSGDVFGYVDENNVVVLTGNLADGTYTMKYEMENGEIVNIGNMVLDSNVYYSITSNLTNCTNSNSVKSVVEGSSYSATISAKSGYKLSSVKVTMGGADISSSAVSGGTINIANVTGNIVITATAVEDVPAYTNLANANSTNKSDWDIWINDARIGSDGGYRANSGTIVTAWIFFEQGDTIYWSGINTTDSADVNGSGVYNISKTVLSVGAMANQTLYFKDISVNSNGGQVTADYYLFENDNGGYLRICGTLTGTINDVIITRNEPIA